MPLRVGVIVEGHGEDGAIRPLLERIWYERVPNDYIEVMPWRGKQGQLLKEDGLKKAVDAVRIKLNHKQPTDWPQLILILIDTEKECPKDLAPKLLKWAQEARSDADIACVMPHPMFETWFVACASSLAGENGLPEDLVTPENPEATAVASRG